MKMNGSHDMSSACEICYINITIWRNCSWTPSMSFFKGAIIFTGRGGRPLQAQVPICGWLMAIPWCVTLSGCPGWLLRCSNYFLYGDIGLFRVWQSTRGKWWLTHWASMLRWIWSISEYNLWLGTPQKGPLWVDHVSGNIEGADLQNKSQSTTHPKTIGAKCEMV